MPAYVLIVDFCGFILAVAGFTMAFRQNLVRRIFGSSASATTRRARQDDGSDPLTYILRISGVMIMIFGVVIGGMVTLFHLAP